MEVQLCEKCLRDSNHLTKYPRGAQCKICSGPFDMYALRHRSSLTKTLVCKRCALQRNVCQCCMLDLAWGVPVELRDRVLSLVHDDPSLKTEEAKNEMMRRFLSLKDVKLGGAQITSKKEALDQLRPLLEVHSSFQQPFHGSRHYLVYNLDPSIPQWQISSRIQDLAGADSVETLKVNRSAHVAALSFKDDDAGEKFASRVGKVSCVTSQGSLTRGQLTIERFQPLVVALGSRIDDVDQFDAKLAASLQKLVFAESREPPSKQAGPRKPGKVTKKPQPKPKRARDVEL